MQRIVLANGSRYRGIIYQSHACRLVSSTSQSSAKLENLTPESTASKLEFTESAPVPKTRTIPKASMLGNVVISPKNRRIIPDRELARNFKPNLDYLRDSQSSRLAGRLFQRQEEKTRGSPNVGNTNPDIASGPNPKVLPLKTEVPGRRSDGGTLAASKRVNMDVDSRNRTPHVRDERGTLRSNSRMGMQGDYRGGQPARNRNEPQRRDSDRANPRGGQAATGASRQRPATGAKDGRRPSGKEGSGTRPSASREPQRSSSEQSDTSTREYKKVPSKVVSEPSPFLKAGVSAPGEDLATLFNSHPRVRVSAVSEEQSRQGTLERAGGDYSRYLPPDVFGDVQAMGPVECARLILSRSKDVGLGQRSTALDVVKTSTAVKTSL